MKRTTTLLSVLVLVAILLGPLAEVSAVCVQLSTVTVSAELIEFPEGKIAVRQTRYVLNGQRYSQENITGTINGIQVRVISPVHIDGASHVKRREDVEPRSALPKAWSDGILYVLKPGNETLAVRHTHPDNYETYYPMQVNRPYRLAGETLFHDHIPVYKIQEWIHENSMQGLALAVGGIVVGLLAIPELGSKVIAGVLAVYLLLLTAYQLSIEHYLTLDLSTELGDGWLFVSRVWAARSGPKAMWQQSFFYDWGLFNVEACCLVCPGGGRNAVML